MNYFITKLLYALAILIPAFTMKVLGFTPLMTAVFIQSDLFMGALVLVLAYYVVFGEEDNDWII